MPLATKTVCPKVAGGEGEGEGEVAAEVPHSEAGGEHPSQRLQTSGKLGVFCFPLFVSVPKCSNCFERVLQVNTIERN